MKPVDGYVEVEPGVRLYVERFGAGPAVVFVHAGGMTHAAWDHQVAALMDRFHTVAYDFRGVGASDRPSTGYSIDVFADDLHQLVQALELERPTIVGHALGSHVALRLAATRPESVGKLVLVSPAPWFVGDRGGTGGFPDELWNAMRSGFARDRAQADLDLIDRSYFHRAPSEAVRLWCFQMALQWPLPVLQQLMARLPEVDHRDVLACIDLPVLVVHGRHDRKNRYEGGVYLAEHIPNARLVTLEESAHCPPVEEVERFNEVVAEFALALPVAGTAGSAG